MSNWRENRVVKKIIKLRIEYRDYPIWGTTIGYDDKVIENFNECKCCGTLTYHLNPIHHKKDNNKIIRICDNCRELWSIIPEDIKVIRKLKLNKLELSDKDVEILLNESFNPKEPNEELKKAAKKYKNKNI